MKPFWSGLILSIALAVLSCSEDDSQPRPPEPFNLVNLRLDDRPISFHYHSTSLQPTIVVTFSDVIDQQSAAEYIVFLNKSGNEIPLTRTFENDSTIVIEPQDKLNFLDAYTLRIQSELASTSKIELG